MKNELPYPFRDYSIYFITSSFILMVLVSGFNYLVDPYQIYNTPAIAGFNNVKSDTWRVYKTIFLARQPMDVAILGTSRAGSLRPDHSVFSNKKAVNLSIPGQPYVETKMLIDLLDPQKTHQIIFGMDFFGANTFMPLPSDFTTENYSEFRKYPLLASISTVRDSYKAVKLSLDARHPSYIDEFFSKWKNETKSKLSEKNVPKNNGNQQIVPIYNQNHHNFIESEKAYLSGVYLPDPRCAFEFEHDNYTDSPMKNFQAILVRAYREAIDLRLFISPSHARQWEVIAAVGLRDKWEEWKRRLVKMNETEAAKAGKPPFPIWDFSGYNSITTEALPVLHGGQTIMKNYIDSSHYTPYVSDLVLDRLFDSHPPGLKVPSDFGVLITSKNLDTHLAHIRAEREEYQKTHPDDIAEIKRLAEEVAKKKFCSKKSGS